VGGLADVERHCCCGRSESRCTRAEVFETLTDRNSTLDRRTSPLLCDRLLENVQHITLFSIHHPPFSFWKLPLVSPVAPGAPLLSLVLFAMRRFPRDVRDFHNVVAPVPISENDPKFLGFSSSGGDSFVLSPGYQAIEGGNVPQVFPGQQHDASPPPAPSNPPLPVSAAPQSIGVVSSPLPPAPSSSPSADPSIESALPMSAPPSGSSSAQVSLSPRPFQTYRMNCERYRYQLRSP